MATKVFQTTGKPAFIVALHNDEAVGSARGIEDHLLPAALASAKDSLERFGGHAQAAGFSLQPSQFDAFKASILKHYYEKLAAKVSGDIATGEKLYDIDADLSDFTEVFMNWLKHAGPFGVENPNPLFRIKNPNVTQVKWLKGQHLKLNLKEGSRQFEALAFFAQGQFNVETGQKIELLAEPGWNYFRGEKRLQLIIRDLRTVAES